MLKLYLDKNLLKIIKKQKLYFLSICLRVIRGLFRRKSGVYTALKVDKYIVDKTRELGEINFSVNYGNMEYWKKQFLISNSIDSNWGFKRNILLENLLLELIASGKIPDNYFDKEDYWSSLQLNWLFFKVRSNKIDVDYVSSVIDGACKILRNNRDFWISRPFTHSELVSNVVKISLYYGNTITLSKKTAEFIPDSVNFILNNLEVYSKSDSTSLNHTNNHVLSNVRALFWATKILPNYKLQKAANHAFEKYCLPLFDDGTLDEGSSIYHFIAAQCIFDLSYFIEVKKLPRVDKLILMLEENGFLTSDKFPVIGDVSPDPSMGCVIDDALKIAKIIHAEIGSNNDLQDNFKYTSEFEFFKHKHWNWVLHTRKQKKHIQHSHNDYGSPILIYKNLPVLFDIGRGSYLSADESNDQTLTRFHSTPQIAGSDQNPRKARDLYPEIFLSPISSNIDCPNDLLLQLFGSNEKKYKVICGKNYVLFPHRLFGGSWSRYFIVNLENCREFVIYDDVELLESESVDFRFFTPEWIIAKSLVEYEFTLNKKTLQQKKYKVPCNNFYGQVAEAYCLEVSSERGKQHNLTTYLRILDE
jgi:hypothetical protein